MTPCVSEPISLPPPVRPMWYGTFQNLGRWCSSCIFCHGGIFRAGSAVRELAEQLRPTVTQEVSGQEVVHVRVFYTSGEVALDERLHVDLPVRVLLRRLSKQKTTPRSHLSLVYDSKILSSNTLLRELELMEGDCIHVVRSAGNAYPAWTSGGRVDHFLQCFLLLFRSKHHFLFCSSLKEPSIAEESSLNSLNFNAALINDPHRYE